MRRGRSQTELQNTLKQKKEAMNWSRYLTKREGLELIPHSTNEKTKIRTAMAVILVRPQTQNINLTAHSLHIAGRRNGLLFLRLVLYALANQSP